MYSSNTQWVDAPRELGAGTTLFAVGDIHGHADELLAMQQLMWGEIAKRPDRRHVVVYLGDYIDRGPAIRRTLQLLIDERAREDGAERIHLVGNHDQYLLELLHLDPSLDSAFITMWFDNGGEATMCDLGVEGYRRFFDASHLATLSARVTTALGPDLVDFLTSLRPMHREGDYVFVHAGIDPAVALDAQDFTDLLLIREPFLRGKGWRHPFTVVHGHSISMPTVHPHRIGVDAGCYKNGALCAVQIEGRRLRLLGATRDADFPWEERLGGKPKAWVWEPAQLVG